MAGGTEREFEPKSGDEECYKRWTRERENGGATCLFLCSKHGTESRLISYNADDFAVKVIGDEGGVIRQPFPVQEEITVLRWGVEGQSDSTADR